MLQQQWRCQQQQRQHSGQRPAGNSTPSSGSHTRRWRGLPAAKAVVGRNQVCLKAQAAGVAEAAASAAPGTRDMSSSLTLDNIRSTLIRQEDSIIFTLIERAQFALNPVVYQPGGVQVPAFGADGSRYPLMEYILRETEQLHGKVRRFTSPDEHAFFPEDLPPLVLPPIEYPGILAPAARAININKQIMDTYLNSILPEIATPGDDGNYGSAATLDVLCLQALSKRIHYGKFVAEAKYRAKPEEYTALIKAQDAAGLMALLTDERVEQMVIERVRLKAATFGQDINPAASTGTASQPSSSTSSNPGQQQQQQQQQDGPGGTADRRYKIQPDVLAAMYDKIVMPLTKEVQVAYLLRRLDHEQ